MSLKSFKSLLIFLLFVFLNYLSAYTQSSLDVEISSDPDRDRFCKEAPDVFTLEAIVDGGTPPYFYKWTFSWNDEVLTDKRIKINPVNSGEISLKVFDSGRPVKEKVVVRKIKAIEIIGDFSFTPDHNCAEEPVHFVPSVSGGTPDYSYRWNFGDGNLSYEKDPVHSYISSGCTGTSQFYAGLTVSDADGCGVYIEHPVHVKNKPHLDFRDSGNPYSPFKHCHNIGDDPVFEVTLQNHSRDSYCITQYDIDWGDGNTAEDVSFPLSHIYSEAGAFELSITARNTTDCDLIWTKIVYNQSNPAAGLKSPGGTEGCAPIEFTFSLEGYETNSIGTTYTWDFGDGTEPVVWDYGQPFENNKISHRYTKSSCENYYGGDFTTIVTVNNGCGEKEAKVTGVRVYEKPEASIEKDKFPLDSICTNEEITLANNSTRGYYGIECSRFSDYLWDFGDGNTSVDELMRTRSWDVPGEYDVVLSVSNPCGSSEDTFKIVVMDPPLADVRLNDYGGCIPFTPEITNNSEGEAMHFSWLISPAEGWSFLNGTSKVSSEPEIRFDQKGSYHMVMYVYNSCDQMDSAVFNLDVYQKPAGKIVDLNDICMTDPVIHPRVEYTDNGIEVHSFSWSFPGGDPSSSGLIDPGIHRYSTSGEYFVNLDLENECGLTQIRDTFYLSEAPAATISSAVSICASDPLRITGTTLSNEASFRWFTRGDGRFSDPSLLNPVYYPGVNDLRNSGTELFIVAYGDPPCASDTAVLSLSVQKVPAVEVDGDIIICEGSDYTIEEAMAENYDYIQWSGDGDGSFSNTGIVRPVYTPGKKDLSLGVVRLTLTAYSIAPCNQPVSKSFTISYASNPVINAGSDADICQEGQLKLSASGSDYQSLKWTVLTGGGSFSNSGLPDPVFTMDPSYAGDEAILVLQAMGGYGCSDVYDTLRLRVIPYPVVNAGDDAVVCETGFYKIEDASVEESSGLTWSVLGDGGLDDNTSLSPVYTPGSNDIKRGEVNLVLTAKGNSVCPDVSDELTIDIRRLPAAIAGPDQEVCKVNDVVIRGESKNGLSSEWETLGSGTFDNIRQLETTYYPSEEDKEKGSTQLVLQVEAIAPCMESATDTLNLVFVDPPEVFAGNDTTICSSSFVPMGAFVKNSTQYEWTSNGTGTWVGRNTLNAVYYPSAADIRKRVVILILSSTNPACPEVTDEMVLHLTPFPEAEAGENDILCEDQVKELNDSQAENYKSLTWATSGDGDFTNKNVLHPNYIPGFSDVERGEVMLYLFAEGMPPCETSEVDSILLTVQKKPLVFAGDDMIIGEGEVFHNTDATEENTEYISWSTMGDGKFDDSSALYSSYNPGSEDLENRGVYLIISGYSISPCSQLVTDTLFLLITPMPKADAGNDLDVCEGSDVEITTATAEEYSELYWTSNGRGVFNNPNSLAPVYIPTVEDIEGRRVILTLNAVGKDPIRDIVVRDSMVVTIVHNTKVNIPALDTACENTDYQIRDVAGSDMDSFQWTTSGDGRFENSSAIDPVYQFSESDKGKDHLYFYLETNSITPCVHIDHDTLLIRLFHEPEPSFTYDNHEGCAPLKVSFTNTSVGEEINYAWNFGNGEESHEEHPSGIIFQQGRIADTTYSVVLSATNRCNTVRTSNNVLVKPVPITDFGMNVAWGCSPKEIYFTNVTTGLADTWLWNWGDGKPDSQDEQPESHIFETGDFDTSYTITLVAKNECGSDTLQKSVIIFPNTVNAFFETDTIIGCAPLEVNFQNYSRGVLGDEPFLNWSWNFGDGNVSEKLNPVHVFEAPGKYPVTLYVNDTCSHASFTTEIDVMGAPKTDFITDKTDYCENDTVFVHPTDMPLDQIAGVTWDFGDSSYSYHLEESHVYEQSGIFDITLLARDILTGCTSSTSKSIKVHDAPVVSFSLPGNDGCQPLEITFKNKTTGGDFYRWDFGNGNVSVETDGRQIFKEPGLFSVTLTALDVEGCSSSFSKNVRVYPKPKAEFESSSLQSCLAPVEVRFINLSEGADDYKWSFGTGGNSKETNPTVSYNRYGDFPVSLISTNVHNCSDTAEMTYHVYHNPVAEFSVDTTEGCDPFTVPFTNLSQYGKEYYWEFDTQGSSGDQNPVFSFRGEGLYSVSLKVKGDGGCSDSIRYKDLITTNPSPISDFEYIRINEIDTVQFTNYSSGATSWLWDFGDGQTSEVENPWHKYRNYGNYNVSLTSINEYNCRNVKVDSINFKLFKGLFIPTAFSPDNFSDDVREFKPVGIGLVSFHFLIYDTWGNLLWETTKLERGMPSESWDGRFNGKALGPDVYVWHIKEAMFRDGSIYKGKKYGSVTLIK